MKEKIIHLSQSFNARASQVANATLAFHCFRCAKAVKMGEAQITNLGFVITNKKLQNLREGFVGVGYYDPYPGVRGRGPGKLPLNRGSDLAKMHKRGFEGR